MEVDQRVTTSLDGCKRSESQRDPDCQQPVRQPTYDETQASKPPADQQGQSPDRLLNALEVAALVGCHEESVRRAYLCGQLKRQRFGVRSWRFHLSDVLDWIRRGAPTRIS